MSLLNRPSRGTHSVLIVLYKSLLVEKQLPEDDLLRIVSPISIAGKPSESAAKKTLNCWIELGLFKENEKGNIEICSEYRPKRNVKVEDAVNQLPTILRKIVFLDINNNNFWDRENNKGADFTRALCWMLAQDVYSTPCTSYNAIAVVESRQFANAQKRRPFQNDTRWSGFKAWSTYLGFSWGAKTFQIDPTNAIKSVLYENFKSTKNIFHEEFFGRLKEVLPVVDHGKYRKKVEDELLTSHWNKVPNHQISTSLSIALLRLKEEGIISFKSLSDSPSTIQLIGKNGKMVREISHISMNLK